MCDPNVHLFAPSNKRATSFQFGSGAPGSNFRFYPSLSHAIAAPRLSASSLPRHHALRAPRALRDPRLWARCSTSSALAWRCAPTSRTTWRRTSWPLRGTIAGTWHQHFAVNILDFVRIEKEILLKLPKYKHWWLQALRLAAASHWMNIAKMFHLVGSLATLDTLWSSSWKG